MKNYPGKAIKVTNSSAKLEVSKMAAKLRKTPNSSIDSGIFDTSFYIEEPELIQPNHDYQSQHHDDHYRDDRNMSHDEQYEYHDQRLQYHNERSQYNDELSQYHGDHYEHYDKRRQYCDETYHYYINVPRYQVDQYQDSKQHHPDQISQYHHQRPQYHKQQRQTRDVYHQHHYNPNVPDVYQKQSHSYQRRPLYDQSINHRERLPELERNQKSRNSWSFKNIPHDCETTVPYVSSSRLSAYDPDLDQYRPDIKSTLSLASLSSYFDPKDSSDEELSGLPNNHSQLHHHHGGRHPYHGHENDYHGLDYTYHGQEDGYHGERHPDQFHQSGLYNKLPTRSKKEGLVRKISKIFATSQSSENLRKYSMKENVLPRIHKLSSCSLASSMQRKRQMPKSFSSSDLMKTRSNSLLTIAQGMLNILWNINKN